VDASRFGASTRDRSDPSSSFPPKKKQLSPDFQETPREAYHGPEEPNPLHRCGQRKRDSTAISISLPRKSGVLAAEVAVDVRGVPRATGAQDRLAEAAARRGQRLSGGISRSES